MRYLILLPLIIMNTYAAACSQTWRVTGYFTPHEFDYDITVLTPITLNNGEYGYFSTAFIRDVKIEGWGKTLEGWYLGRFNNQWHKSEYPLNAQGRPLEIGQVATDTRRIKPNTALNIPHASAVLKQTKFVSTDVGSAIKGKKIDIYTGEGKYAKQKTFALTKNNAKVCIENTHLVMQ